MTHIHWDEAVPSTKTARKIVTALIVLFLIASYVANNVEFVNFEEEDETDYDHYDSPVASKAKAKGDNSKGKNELN